MPIITEAVLFNSTGGVIARHELKPAGDNPDYFNLFDSARRDYELRSTLEAMSDGDTLKIVERWTEDGR